MTSSPRQSWRQFAAAIGKAFALGLILFVPIAVDAWWTTRPAPPSPPLHALRFESTAPPANDDALRAWIAARPGATGVAVTRAAGAGGSTRVEARWRGPDLQLDSVPWQEIAYPKHHDASVITANVRSHIDLGVGYYTSLLALCANLGYLVFGWRRLRSSGRMGERFARPSGRTVGLGIGAGLAVGVAALVWEQVPWVGGSVAGALGGTGYWPAWARWSVLLLVPVGLPIAQECFFRGRDDGDRVAVSAVFALVQLLPAAFVPAFVAGLVFARLRRATGTLWAPMIANALFLALSVTVPLLLPGDVRAVFDGRRAALPGMGR